MAVDDHEKPEAAAQTEENQALLVLGVVGIVDEAGTFIGEDGLRIFEADSVLARVQRGLPGVPFEP
jgi:hypothetical protein